MAYTTAHGPPLFDATHAWEPETATAPPVLNDANKVPRVLPQIVIDGCENFYGLPDLVANAVGRTVGVGELLDPPRQTGKTIVYEGRIEADDREELMATLIAMGRGFGDRDVEGTMTITPWAPFAGTGDDLIVWTFSALVTDFRPEKAWVLTDGLYEWGFSLTLRMSDPFFHAEEATYP